MEPLAELGALARRRRQSEIPKVTISAMADRIGIGSTKLASFELGKDPLSTPLQAKIETYFGWPQGTIAKAATGEPVSLVHPSAGTVGDAALIELAQRASAALADLVAAIRQTVKP